MDGGTITLIIGLSAPILGAAGGLLVWGFKSRKEEHLAVEERALERRIETYNTILEPMIMFFSPDSTGKLHKQASAKLLSMEYRKAGFSLITFGSDEMVNNYNDMMQHFYNDARKSETKVSMEKFARFILSIRKDVYSPKTELEVWDMLKFMITDIDNFIQD